MKEVYWGYWLIVLGVFITIVMMLISNLTTSETQDYYLVKEVTEAAMMDAVDLGYYRTNGKLKINEQKFMESFLRRFSENVSLTKTYDIEFLDLYEEPPKVSVKVSSNTSTFVIAGGATEFGIVSKVDAILELPPKNASASTNAN